MLKNKFAIFDFHIYFPKAKDSGVKAGVLCFALFSAYKKLSLSGELDCRKTSTITLKGMFGVVCLVGFASLQLWSCVVGASCTDSVRPLVSIRAYNSGQTTKASLL